jgi:GTPase SAR1 family protein
MKIIMLGHAGVGKTTYMASMYGTLQNPINGFSLRTEDSVHHYDLLQAFNNIRQGRYPATTTQRALYNFSLLFRGNAVFPFQWVDYRGSALIERTGSSEQAQQLIKDLKKADGILLFCDADPKVRTRIRSQIARMTALVTQALKGSEITTIIAVVFTKTDLVEEIDDELVGYVGGLLEAIHSSKPHVGTILPIACGKKMVNPEAPVLFVLHFGILFQAIRLSLEIEEWKQIEQHFEAKGETIGGIVGNLFKSMVGGITTYDYARAARRLAEEKKCEIDKLEKPANLLEAYLEDVPIVYGELLRSILSG